MYAPDVALGNVPGKATLTGAAAPGQGKRVSLVAVGSADSVELHGQPAFWPRPAAPEVALGQTPKRRPVRKRAKSSAKGGSSVEVGNEGNSNSHDSDEEDKVDAEEDVEDDEGDEDEEDAEGNEDDEDDEDDEAPNKGGRAKHGRAGEEKENTKTKRAKN